MSDTPQWVLDKIEEVKKQSSTELDLSASYPKRGDLETIPAEVFELTFLTSLIIDNHKIQEIPESITQLTNLTSLSLSRNQIKKILRAFFSLDSLEYINFSQNKLSEIPEYISSLKKLLGLNLEFNRIRIVPDCISDLQSLQAICLGGNIIDSFPIAITKLLELKRIDLGGILFIENQKIVSGGNRINSLPAEVKKLKKLKELILRGNLITEIPEGIFEISSLKYLDLSHNLIHTISTKLYSLENLENLSLSNNRIATLPAAISKLKNLRFFSISGNLLKFLPDSLSQMQSLEVLNCSDNKIVYVSESIIFLENLRDIYIYGNPLESIPIEIAEQDLDNIRNYYRQIREAGKEKLYEAKLLIVGEAGSGKTTLANKILDANYELLPDNTTHGIDIHEYIFPYQDHDFRVNIWDFGGQEIYHATHRFFLTERSLYILVADERKEDTDFDYWLNIIQLLGKKSPVIILLNEKLGRQRKINESALRGQFPNIKEILSLDLSDSEKIPKLVNKIQAYLQTLDHIGDPLPKTWTNLRTFLETDGRNYLTLQDYLDLCDDFGFKNNTDKLSVSQYLHDLGILLHFQDDALLNKTVILAPEWATDAVYQILDHPEIIANYGTFSRKDLSLISIDTAFENMQDEILQLMLKFQLCYRITETANNYISPQLLDPQQPQYRWKKDKNLLAQYRYDFMPKGIISRLIVVMNKLIKDQRLVWRSGVILYKNETYAEVIENLAKREISIRVRGDQKRNLLTIIFHEIDKIHESYHALKVDKLIPCNCDQCKSSTTPYLFPLTDVNRAIAAKRQTIECRYSFEPVGVQGLIDDIYDPATNLPSPAQPAEYMRDERIIIKDSTVTISRNPVTETNPESPAPKESTPQLPSFMTSAFAMGYLFALVAVVILVAASQLPPISLAIALIGITMLYVLIGVFTLRASGQTKDESMVTLAKTVLEQLPVLGNLFSFLKNLTQKE